MKEMILAVGNTMNGDDGIGSYIVEHVTQYICESNRKDEDTISSLRKIVTIDCGTLPENYTSVIRNNQPDILIILDAAELGLSVGSFRIIKLEHIGVMSLSTHNMPLSLFVSYVSQFCQEVILLGIQPKRMDPYTKLSPELCAVGEEIARLLVNGRLDEIQIYKPQRISEIS